MKLFTCNKKISYCHKCGKPATKTNKLKRGMCNGCYLAEYHDREKKSECQCCSQGDLRVLVRRKDIDDETWLTLCANCAQIRGKRKLTLDQLKTELMPLGDRRTGDRRKVRRRMFERRSGKDRRFWEREEIEERRKMDRRIS